MFNFNGSTIATGSMTPFGVYAGYLLLHSGDVVLAIGFLTLAGISFLLVVATLSRYIINYQRNKYLLE